MMILKIFMKRTVATAPVVVPTIIEPLVFEDLYDIKMNIEKFFRICLHVT